LKKIITNQELLERLNKVWLNTEDVCIIANCSRAKALKIKKQIYEELVQEGSYTDRSHVPANKLVSALGLDELVEKLKKENRNE